MTPQEIALIRAVLAWGAANGWSRRLPRIYSLDDGLVEVYVQRGCLCVARVGYGHTFLTPVTVTEAVSVLAALRVLPSGFSGLGREALVDHAEVCTRFTGHLIEHALKAEGDDAKTWWAAYIRGMAEGSKIALRKAVAGVS